MKKKTGEKTQGGITVTVQREDRLIAISNLASAIKEVAKALNSDTIVVVENCHLEGNETGIKIEGKDIVTKTEIRGNVLS